MNCEDDQPVCSEEDLAVMNWPAPAGELEAAACAAENSAVSVPKAAPHFSLPARCGDSPVGPEREYVQPRYKRVRLTDGGELPAENPRALPRNGCADDSPERVAAELFRYYFGNVGLTYTVAQNGHLLFHAKETSAGRCPMCRKGAAHSLSGVTMRLRDADDVSGPRGVAATCAASDKPLSLPFVHGLSRDALQACYRRWGVEPPAPPPGPYAKGEREIQMVLDAYVARCSVQDEYPVLLVACALRQMSEGRALASELERLVGACTNRVLYATAVCEYATPIAKSEPNYVGRLYGWLMRTMGKPVWNEFMRDVRTVPSAPVCPTPALDPLLERLRDIVPEAMLSEVRARLRPLPGQLPDISGVPFYVSRALETEGLILAQIPERARTTAIQHLAAYLQNPTVPSIRLSRFLAFALCNRNRCGHVPGKQGMTKVLYYFNGVRFVKAAPMEATVKASRLLSGLVEHLQQAAGVVVGPTNPPPKKRKKKQDGAADSEPPPEHPATIMGRMVDAPSFMNQIYTNLERFLFTADLYDETGLPSPSDFVQQLDAAPNLMGFSNGVYDVFAHRFYPAGTVPTSFLVSMSTGYDYLPPEHPDAEMMMEDIEREIYDKVFVDIRVRLAVKCLVGSVLQGGNPYKKFMLFCGPSGDNSKSYFVNHLLRSLLGDYFDTVKVDILTDTSVLSVHKKRLVVINEGNRGIKLNSQLVKTLTGDNIISIRGLYSEATSAPFQPKLVFVSNYPPVVDTTDAALLRRYYTVSFDSRFVPGVTEDDPENRVFVATDIDELKMRAKTWAPFHFLLALKWLRQFKTEEGGRLPELPESSAAARAMYEETPEAIFLEWFKELYEWSLKRPTDARYYIKVDDVLDVWTATLQSHRERKRLAKHEVVAFLEKLSIVPFVKNNNGLMGRNFIVAWLRESLPTPTEFNQRQ